MKLVLATQNKKKVEEMSLVLTELGVEVISQGELGVKVDVEETGTTFTENARLKAQAVMEATGLPAIADDSGICVDALNGAPGIFSARYGGEGLNDKDRYMLLLDVMKGQTNRAAHFHASIVCVFPDGQEIVAEGDCHGTVAFVPMGDDGFGYNPIFFVPDKRKTFAQMSLEERASISHRGKALRLFKESLEEHLKG